MGLILLILHLPLWGRCVPAKQSTATPGKVGAFGKASTYIGQSLIG